MTFEFKTIDTAVATATIKDNSFTALLAGAPSPFETLEIGKSITFDRPIGTPEEMKDAEKLQKDLGDHIRLVRPEYSPLVRKRDENGVRTFVATIQEKIVRDRTKDDEKPANDAGKGGTKPTGKAAAAK